MKNLFSTAGVTAALLAGTAMAGGAHAAVIGTANLFLPQFPANSTPIGVQGVSTPSQTTLVRPGYTITFSVPTNQGIVQGSIPSTIHAVPVAGVTPVVSPPGLQPTYLTGDYNSPQTPDPARSGNYLSTGIGSITVTFDTPQLALGLLWGSIDTQNLVTLNDVDGSKDTFTGTQAQAATVGFASNGFQGPRGSAYVLLNSSEFFNSVTFSSTVTSFELASVVASTQSITPMPLPASAPMFGAALLGLAGLGYAAKRKSKASAAA